jgi:Domain of unknown function (DUF4340)
MVHVDRLPKPKENGDANAAPPVREVADGPGGKAVTTSISSLEPLSAKRALGVMTDAQLASMGFSPVLRTLEVTAGGKTLQLDVGEAAYGDQGRYVRRRGDNVVFLVDGALVKGLEGGSDTLLERRLVVFDVDKIASVSIEVQDRKAQFSQADADVTGARRLVLVKDGIATTEANDRANDALTSLRNVRATKLASPDVARTAGPVVVRFEIESSTQQRRTVVMSGRTDAEGYLAAVTQVGGAVVVYELTTTTGKKIVDEATDALKSL